MNEDSLRLLEYEGMKELFRPHLDTKVGAALLDRLKPYRTEERLRRRLDLVGETAELHSRGGRLPLGGCRDVGALLDRVHADGRPLEPEELLEVRETLEAARHLVRAVQGIANEHPDLAVPRLAGLIGEVPGFTVLTELIGETVDGRGRVRDEASPRLSGLRRRIRELRERIDRKVATLLGRKSFRTCLQEANPRFRSGRVVFAVKSERRGEVNGVLHDVSQSGATHFIEPAEVVAEGNALEDVLAGERREITRVLWEATVKVLAHEDEIRATLGVMAVVDLVQASARGIAGRGLIQPELVDSGAIRFRRARHPLLLLLHGESGVVPVDLRLGDDFFLLVITGPNTGGKTVSMKTLGLLLLMAQSGLPVPADAAEFSMMEDVFADIGDEQSLEQSLSTFSSHMSRVARFLDGAGERTLVLIDELGAGTDPAEGAALGRAILDFLHARRVPTVVTTHLGNLKTYAYTHEGVSNASAEFDVETLSPTYRLLMGQPGASKALTIAERLGVPAEVVGRAREFVAPDARLSEEVLENAQQIRSLAEKNLREAEGFRSDTRAMKDRAAEELREAEGRRAHVEREAEREMEEVLGRVRRLVRDYAKSLGNAPKPFGEKARELAARAEEEIRATPLGEKREEFARSLRRGDEVYVPKLSERFMVHAVKKKDRTLTLVRGSLQIEVPFDDVTWV